jgi:AraC family transcriptional regulator
MTARTLHLVANRYAPMTRHAPHEHGDLQVSLILSGRVRERVGNREESGAALSVVVKDPGVRHADDFGDGGAFMARLSVPRVEFASLTEGPGRSVPWRWTHEARVAAPFLRLVRRAGLAERTFAADDDDIVDLVAAISARRVPSDGAPPAWLAAIVAGISEGWRPGLSVAELAGRAGVHPVYLARCIRRWYGVAAGDVLREARLSRAADALVGTAGTVSSVAHRMGFADEAHLCRSFSAATGSTPARFRRAAAAFAR